MKPILIALASLLLAASCSTPVRSTAKVGFKAAELATKAAWEVGKAGTVVATTPLRMGRDRSSSKRGTGGSYQVRGRRYHVMSPSQAHGFSEVGTASYYSGRHTASGERFSSRGMTAAHKTLPFGTKVKITNLSNGHSIVVRINDRGPFTKGRIIDITKRGADKLGFRRQGIAKVKIEVR